MAVIFDMDGVIVDSALCHFTAWQSVWQKRGVSYTWEDFRRNFGRRTDMHIRCMAGNRLSEEDVMAIVREKDSLLREIIRNSVKALPGAIELIKSLRKYGYGLAIGSSSPAETVELVLKALGIEHYFNALVSGGEVAEGKPSPEIFLLAARKLNREPPSCIVVEDAVVGITAAKRCGMYVLAVTNTHPREYLKEADLVIDSLEEVTVQGLEGSLPGGRVP